MWGGPTADTLWLRLTHRTGTTPDEHEVRAATSTDGVHRERTGAWTLPDEGPLRIGLVSMNTAGATARFAYARTYHGWHSGRGRRPGRVASKSTFAVRPAGPAGPMRARCGFHPEGSAPAPGGRRGTRRAAYADAVPEVRRPRAGRAAGGG
ncbi:hypothetical protein QQY24_02020 [Streptomyces sp. TG1A-8]|uniref:hypothetical protein n=1 Tax=Streptomyces sp. TG1A-8 TaxID=3051385 RepID=UPI00265B9B6B|nr:hypothetical protein [Streptomyces sp. TG1A-8]MDO0924247.1 hypothetical protein [Streptomyces sp. TG1A-8]